MAGQKFYSFGMNSKKRKILIFSGAGLLVVLLIAAVLFLYLPGQKNETSDEQKVITKEVVNEMMGSADVVDVLTESIQTKLKDTNLSESDIEEVATRVVTEIQKNLTLNDNQKTQVKQMVETAIASANQNAGTQDYATGKDLSDLKDNLTKLISSQIDTEVVKRIEEQTKKNSSDIAATQKDVSENGIALENQKQDIENQKTELEEHKTLLEGQKEDIDGIIERINDLTKKGDLSVEDLKTQLASISDDLGSLSSSYEDTNSQLAQQLQTLSEELAVQSEDGEATKSTLSDAITSVQNSLSAASDNLVQQINALGDRISAAEDNITTLDTSLDALSKEVNDQKQLQDQTNSEVGNKLQTNEDKIKTNEDQITDNVDAISTLSGQLNGYKIVVCTQAEYDAMGTHSEDTIYFIKK